MIFSGGRGFEVESGTSLFFPEYDHQRASFERGLPPSPANPSRTDVG